MGHLYHVFATSKKLELRRRYWLAPHPQPLYPGERPDTHRKRIWEDLRARSRKSSTIQGFNPRTVQHVASRCNGYAILGFHIWEESANYFHYATCYLLDLLWFLLFLRCVVFIRCCLSFYWRNFRPADGRRKNVTTLTGDNRNTWRRNSPTDTSSTTSHKTALEETSKLCN